MSEQVLVDREEQEALKEQVGGMIAATTSYDEVRKNLEALGFQAKEDRPALALWENGEHEIFVVVHVDSKTSMVQDYAVATFEEMEGFE